MTALVWRRRAVVPLVLLLGLLTACDTVVGQRIVDARAAAGAPATPRSLYLDSRAAARAQELCAARSTTPSTDPVATYRGETAVAAVELVGRARLDPAVTDPQARHDAASGQIWDGALSPDPRITQARWDELGVGDDECADGNLYVVVVLRENPTMPASGRYVTAQTPADQVTVRNGIVYGRATNYQGIVQDLVLDLYLPAPGPDAARPLLVMVHGGSFVGGSRKMYVDAATEYARRGFVVASIDYRLQDRTLPDEERYTPGVLEGADDTSEAVRFLRSRAAAYGIDPGRVALMGSSAGSAIVYGTAVLGDPTPGGPLAAYPADVDAVVGTGGHLTPGLDQLTFDEDVPPVMMHYFEVDTNAGNPWYYAYETCQAIQGGGGTCDFVVNPGQSHTIGLGPTTKWWTPEIGPFLWENLDLAGLTP